MDERRTPERYEYEAERARMFQEYASFFPPDQPSQGDRTAEGKKRQRRYETPLFLKEFLNMLPFLLLACGVLICYILWLQ